MKTLSIIGAGKVGQVLGRLWNETGVFRIGQVLNRSGESARRATEFIGAGRPVGSISQLAPADLWMIGTRDDSIAAVARSLAASPAVHRDQGAFHLSGAHPGRIMQRLGEQGLRLASLHPLKTFPDAARGYRSFDETWCGLEGEPTLTRELGKALDMIGARVFHLQEEQKLLYHAANTVLCNYLLALMDVGVKCYELAGIDSRRAREMVAPLMTETLGNGLELGPVEALTGPVVRGDAEVLAAHVAGLPRFARDLYRELGLHAVEMAREAGRVDAADARRLRQVLRSPPGDL